VALTSTRSTDYTNLGDNCVAGVPKSGYTPAKGHLVRREDAQNDEWDLCANSELPGGLVESVNSGNGTISVLLLIGGVSIILEHDGTADKGEGIQATDTAVATNALGVTIPRTVVKGVAIASGVGRVVSTTVGGTTNTCEVVFPS